VAQALPELSEDGPRPADATDPPEARRRLFDTVARLLRDADRPALLVAEDAQWCDPPTRLQEMVKDGGVDGDRARQRRPGASPSSRSLVISGMHGRR